MKLKLLLDISKLKILILLLVLLPLGGCLFDNIVGDTLTLTGPSICYPPCTVTLEAKGVAGGQFTFEVEGNTYTQASNTLTVRLTDLPSLDEPLIATVRWSSGTETQTSKLTISLSNRGPVIGEPTFNGLYASQFYSLVQSQRFIVEFPDTYDPEGGPVHLVDVDLRSVEWGKRLAIFCPPYEGTEPPKPENYHVKTSLSIIENAFAFYGYWREELDVVNNLPIAPKQGEWTYPRASWCPDAIEYWPLVPLPAGDLTLDVTFEDEKGQSSTRTFRIPIAPYAPCGGVQTGSACI